MVKRGKRGRVGEELIDVYVKVIEYREKSIGSNW